MERLKVLFITYAYPPLKYPRSFQISHLVQFLRKNIDISVMAHRPDANLDLSSLQFTPLDNVYYPKKTHLTALFDKIGGHRIKSNCFADTFYPQCRELYISSRKLFLQQNYHSIITFGQPMSVHIAGLKLKKKDPHVHWVAHFSDPWVDNPYTRANPWVQYLNQRYQNLVFNNADVLLFTSPETIDLVMKNYTSAVRKKAIYLPHSFNSDLYPSELPMGGQTLIRHLGNFYGARQPETFFQALQILKSRNCLPSSFKVEFIGADNSYNEKIREKNIEDIVVIKPSIGYLDSLKLMAQSHMLLLIDAPMELSPFFPSKLADYIGSNRPIFGITPSGTSKRIIEEMGFLVAHPNNPEEIADQFLKMLTLVRKCTLKSIPDSIRNLYSVSTVGKQVSDILHDIVG